METRKVQQVGGGTVTVSLPRPWAEEHDIEAGERVFLYRHLDGSLVLRRGEKERSDLATIRLPVDAATSATPERLLQTTYAAGYREIVLTRPEGFSPAQSRAIARAVRGLTGVDITQESAESVTIDGLLDPADVSIRQSVIQLRYSTLSMHEATMAALEDGGGGVAQVRDRYADVERVVRHVARHYNRGLQEFDELDALGLDRAALAHYYQIATQLERAATHIRTVADHLEALDPELPPEDLDTVCSLGEDAGALLEASVEAALNGGDTDRAHAVLDSTADLVDRARDVDARSMDSAAAYRLGAIIEAILAIARAGGEIAETALHRSVTEG